LIYFINNSVLEKLIIEEKNRRRVAKNGGGRDEDSTADNVADDVARGAPLAHFVFVLRGHFCCLLINLPFSKIEIKKCYKL
jgi:hypothetical protein